MARYQSDNGDDDLGALDFSYSGGAAVDEDTRDDADPLDFVGGQQGDDSAAALDDLSDYVQAEVEPAPAEDLDAVVEAAQAVEEPEQPEGAALFTVTNPPGTVSVSAAMDGNIQRVELAPTVTAMTESELAEEILVIAGLARKKALAGQYEAAMEQARELDAELGEAGEAAQRMSEVLTSAEGMNLPTPAQAAAAEADVFATRYTA